jgi:site-specific DNA recombinase
VRYVQDGNQVRQVYDVDDPAAAIVRRLFALYLSGRGSDAIAQQFAAEGLPTPTDTTQWTRNVVRGILRRAWRYAGYVELNVVSPRQRPYYRGRGNWQAIIDDATLQRVLAERKARETNRKIADARHALTGLCYCGTCGGVMAIHRISNQGRRYDYVRCERHRPSLYVQSTYIVDVLRVFIADLATRNLDDLLADDDADRDDTDAQLQAQAKALANLARARERANTAYVDGNLDAADYAAQVRRLKAQAAQVEAEIERLESLAAAEAQRGTRRLRVDDLVADGLARLDGPDTTATNMWLREHLRLTIHPDKDVDVEFI